MLIDKDEAILIIGQAPDIKTACEQINEMKAAALFICDHRRCAICTSGRGECCRTTDIEHAEFFEKIGTTYSEIINKNGRKTRELDMLEQFLKQHGIEYTRHDESSEWIDWHQIRVGDRADGSCEWDVICHRGSYGYQEGLLEGRGSLFGDEVEGYLTADEVIRKIEEAE